MSKLVSSAAAALLMSVVAAQATPVQTITFGGTLGYGYESSGLFAAPNSQLGGKAFSIALSFDPSALTSDTCGNNANTSCMWNFGAGTSEAVTIGGITQVFAATSGNIQFSIGGGDAIYINAYGTNGLYFGGQFRDSNKLFSSQTNANNPDLLVDFTNVALNSGQFQSSGLGPDHNTSFGTNPTALSASYSSGLGGTPPPASVPESSSLAIMVGGSMMGMVVLVRRRKAKSA